MVTKEQLLVPRLPKGEVTLGDGTQVRVRAVPVDVVSRYIMEFGDNTEDPNAALFFVLHSVIDDNGARMFTEEDRNAISDSWPLADLITVSSKTIELSMPEAPLEQVKN